MGNRGAGRENNLDGVRSPKIASSRDEGGTWGCSVNARGECLCTTGIQQGLECTAGPGKSRQPGPQPMWSPPGAQNQTLRRLEQVLHVDSGPCLPHLLSHLCQDLGPGAFRLAARMYLQKGRCWCLELPIMLLGGQG